MLGRIAKRGQSPRSRKRAIAASPFPLWLACRWGCRSFSVFLEGEEVLYRQPLLLWEPHPPHQFGEPWVGTQRIEEGVRLQTQQKFIALLTGSVEPVESLIFVSQVGIELSNPVCRKVTILALRLPGFNAFG